ncbi:MAG: hypothetical protein K6D92_05175 [Erysipelotrichaceae bacterium]|jgi:hypothetical protein|nr:hypothetical protein [Erysipelotrichaceae bacterium]
MKRGILMIGCGMTVISLFVAGVYFGSLFHHMTAGILIAFAFSMSFLWTIIWETMKK